ncbi:MAG TPA: hypothetical protein VKH81_07005 [Candidatus Angelobacter sp.]|nr:hypothetical protein [Candidatus Angelobacter sp.]
MKQTIHIFTKDLRRFTWEIALSLILLALYGWCQPVTWNPIDAIFMAQANSWRYLGANVCGFLLILAWAALLIRVISEDSPAGDRQFWITRPYRWPSLLAAKFLFFIAVVNIPLLMLQLGLLQAAGFPPFHYLARLVAMQLFLGACYLCVAALAAVARGGRQFARAAIVVLIFFLIVLWLGVSTNRAVGFDLHVHPLDWIEEAVLIVLPMVVIVRQYARRKTAQSRWILLAGGLVLLLLTAAQPANTLNEAEYPLLAPGMEPRLEVSLESPLRPATAALAIRNGKSRGKTVLLRLPLSGADMPAGYLAQVNAIRITLEASDGTRWDSGWKNAYHLFPDDPDFPHDPARKVWRGLDTPLEISRNFFDHVQDTDVTVRVATAATLFREHQGPALTPVDGQITVPDFGYCVTEQRSSERLLCRTAQREVPLMTFSRRLFKSCPPTTEDLAGLASERGAWIGTGYQNGFGLSPVSTVEFYFGDSEGKRLVGCPGTPFTPHRAEAIRQFRVENDFTGVKLADYVMQ